MATPPLNGSLESWPDLAARFAGKIVRSSRVRANPQSSSQRRRAA